MIFFIVFGYLVTTGVSDHAGTPLVFISDLDRNVGLFADRRHTRKHLAFHVFEQGAAAGRNIRNLVRQAELVDARHRIAAADERVGTLRGSLGDSLGHGARTGCELVDLEHAHGAVPKDRLALEDLLAEHLLAFLGDVNAFPAVGNIVGGSHIGVGIGRECVGDQRVGRHHDLHTLLLGFGQNIDISYARPLWLKV